MKSLITHRVRKIAERFSQMRFWESMRNEASASKLSYANLHLYKPTYLTSQTQTLFEYSCKPNY